jgi:hypothetical protein
VSLSNRQKEKQKREDIRVGTILAALYNLSKAQGQGKYLSLPGNADFTPANFFPYLKEDEPVETEEQQAENFMRMFGCPSEVNNGN